MPTVNDYWLESFRRRLKSVSPTNTTAVMALVEEGARHGFSRTHVVSDIKMHHFIRNKTSVSGGTA